MKIRRSKQFEPEIWAEIGLEVGPRWPNLTTNSVWAQQRPSQALRKNEGGTIFDRTSFGKQLKWLTIIDEFIRKNLCLDVGYRSGATM